MSLVVKYPHLVRTIKMFLAFVALFIGGMIYVVFRSKSLLMFSWFEALGLSPMIDAIRIDYGDKSLYAWIRYSFPAALWLLSYLLVVDSIWGEQKNREYAVFIIALPVIAILSEVLQGLGILPGASDILDIISYLLAITLFIIIKIIDK